MLQKIDPVARRHKSVFNSKTTSLFRLKPLISKYVMEPSLLGFTHLKRLTVLFFVVNIRIFIFLFLFSLKIVHLVGVPSFVCVFF
jgi:hypothetical protein